MARYIECEMACAEVDKGDLLVGNNAEFAKEIINRTPTADVMTKNDVAKMLFELKKELQAKAIYPSSAGIRAFIYWKVVDATIKEYIKKYTEREDKS